MNREMDGYEVTDWLVADHSAFNFRWFIRWHNLIDWCDDYPGIGRFYVKPEDGTVWFEREEDFVMFTLRWGKQ